MSGELVLVTGANGYIASHVVQQLMQAGYRVRGSVRDLTDQKKVGPLKDICPDARYPLELVEGRLQIEADWREAVKDCTYVIHIASPQPIYIPKHEDDVIRPAVDGTTYILNACKEERTVIRVVMTSSLAAVSDAFNIGGSKVWSEADWTDPNKKGILAYHKSKVLAERAAWDFVNGLNDDEKFELAIINPTSVVGPVITTGELSLSLILIHSILDEDIALLPKLHLGYIDVRDVATAHIKAMKVEEAAGNRHILYNKSMWMKDVAIVMDKEFKKQGYNIKTKTGPGCCISCYAQCCDDSAKLILDALCKVTKLDNTRMVSVLGIEPIRMKHTILDCCYSLIEKGFVEKKARYNYKERHSKRN